MAKVVQGTMPLNISWLKSGIRVSSNSSYGINKKTTEKNTKTYQLWIKEMTADVFSIGYVARSSYLF
jgi:hypothetical protein